MLKGIIIGLLCFFIFLFFNIFIFHRFNIKRRFYLIGKIFFLVLLLYITLFIFTPTTVYASYLFRFIAAFLNAFFIYFFIWYFYLHFIQIIDRSPSTRILIEIENSLHKKLSYEEIKKVYTIDTKFSHELEDMVILGRLKKEEGYFINTQKGTLHCKIFKFIREYLKLPRN
ncbi:MAG: hypothetical protein A2166_02625 [Omnitrophica WOR_2 bacterium RBG_13_41_10]|nr:MAG: hypothetical protein A2166_02625 [Omnitrophica WOR_2 bacterium RBG_13_41_10]